MCGKVNTKNSQVVVADDADMLVLGTVLTIDTLLILSLLCHACITNSEFTVAAQVETI